MKLNVGALRLRHEVEDATEEEQRIIRNVVRALREKGYGDVMQLSGYILTGDPTYITSHMGARNEMSRIDHFRMCELVVRHFLENVLGESP